MMATASMRHPVATAVTGLLIIALTMAIITIAQLSERVESLEQHTHQLGCQIAMATAEDDSGVCQQSPSWR